MDTERALDDLKIIRQIMKRTRRREGKIAGRIMILWGAIWFTGFLGNQFLPSNTTAWLWPVLDTIGAVVSVGIEIRAGRRNDVHSPVSLSMLLYWLALFTFDGLLLWLFHLHTSRDLTLLFTLSVALAFVQLGIFTYWAISGIGVLIAVFVTAAVILLPGYLDLVMALLGGGLLVGSGAWLMRSEG